MTLGPKDLIATLGAAIAGYLGFLALKGAALPWHLSIRWTMIILLAAGFTGCIAASTKQAPDMTSPWNIMFAILGGLALVVAVIGLIKPTTTMIELLAGIVVLMWALATYRHATT